MNNVILRGTVSKATLSYNENGVPVITFNFVTADKKYPDIKRWWYVYYYPHKGYAEQWLTRLERVRFALLQGELFYGQDAKHHVSCYIKMTELYPLKKWEDVISVG